VGRSCFVVETSVAVVQEKRVQLTEVSEQVAVAFAIQKIVQVVRILLS
jgi:hypothetical protein